MRIKTKSLLQKHHSRSERGLNQKSEDPGSRLSRTTSASGSIEIISLYELYTLTRYLRDTIECTS